MTKQGRNAIFIEAYKQMLDENSAKLMVGIGRDDAGKTFIVMDFDNSPADLLDSIKEFMKTLEKLREGGDGFMKPPSRI